MQANIKILWVNPSFLDYRVPLYGRLYQLTNKKFKLIYSQNRVPERVNKKVKKEMGEDAIALPNERYLQIGKEEKGFANEYIKIPFQPKLLKTILKTEVDIIIAEGFFQWTPYVIIKKILHRKPLLIAYERTKHTEKNSPLWRTVYRKFVSKFADGFIANGILTKEYLVDVLKVKDDKIYIGGMSADNDNLIKKLNSFPLEKQKEFKFNMIKHKADSLIYLYVGQLIERKGIMTMIKAWQAFKETNKEGILIIVGEGNLRENIENYIASNSIKDIIITGKIDYDEIYKFFAIADILIMPTLEDNWSLVVPEAMSCKLPIACSIYNGCWPELITHDNGWLFDPLNLNEFVDTLIQIDNNKVFLSKMGEKSFEIVQNFSPNKVAENILSACHSTMKKLNKVKS
jgi:glycosyltransferase involved in cell wall biosynthesis